MGASLKKILADNLRALHEHEGEHRRNQAAMAVACGWGAANQRQYGRILKGETGVSLDTLADIARAWNLSPWQLLVPDLDPKQLPVLAQIAQIERAVQSLKGEPASTH